MEGLVVIIILSAVIAVFDLLASRYGVDSRDVVVDASRPVPTAGLTIR